jgi:protein TonB
VTILTNTFVAPPETDSLPVVIKKHPVEWTAAAQRSRRQGVIILQATVNADGLVDAVKVLRADDTGFGIPEAAVAAAKQYRFKPGMKDGVRIKTFATITQPYRFVFTR